MNMKTKNMCGVAAVLVAAVLGLAGCVGTNADRIEAVPSPEIAKADQYAIDVLGMYYLWNEEVERILRGWIQTLAGCRWKWSGAFGITREARKWTGGLF